MSSGVVWIEGTKYLNLCGGRDRGEEFCFFIAYYQFSRQIPLVNEHGTEYFHPKQTE